VLKPFKTLLPYLKKYRLRYFAGFVCLAAVDGAQILIPQFIKRAVDEIASGRGLLEPIVLSCAALLAVAAVLSAGRFLWRYFIHGSSRRIEMELRDRLFAHLLTLSSGFYQKQKIGDLMARSTNDLNAVRMAIGMGFVAFVDGTVMAAAILAVMFYQDAKVAAFAVLPLPVITVLILGFGKVVGSRFKRVQAAYSALSDLVQESVAGIRVLKSFVKERTFARKFADLNDDYRTANMSLVALFGFFFPLISFLSGITTLIMLRFGGERVIEGRMSAGELVAMFSYIEMLIWPMLGAGFTVNMMQRGAASLARVNEILDTEREIASPASPVVLEPPRNGAGREIRVCGLSFSYAEGREVLRAIDLLIPGGAVVGLLGRTGSGKSTLLKLFPRIIDPPPGTVFIDGIDVRDYELGTLRSLFGVTPQDTYLFSDSVRNNIAYGAADASEGRLAAVADISTISRDLGDFKDGWNTVIGERGLTLSGGQKQRTAISRALARDPEILVLDDSFSAIDTETEAKVLDALLAERSGRTTILVSHRVSTLRHADRVVVLDSGRIVETGSHPELIAAGGFYAETARLQRLEGGSRG
jgi:ATP-binding cassette subfamily B protein